MSNQTLEQTFEELDEVIKQLEQAEVSLEDSFALYHKGMELLKDCNEKIDTVEKKIMMLDEEGGQHEL